MSETSQAAGRPTAGDQRLSEILATAEAMFFEKGYRGVSIRDLASAVGVQMSSLYYYFPSKDDILYRIIRHYLDGLLESVQQTIVESQSASYTDRLRQLIRQSSLYLIEHRKAAGISISDIHELPDAQQDELHEMISCYEQVYLQLVADGKQHGEFIDVDTALAVYPMLGAEVRLSAWFSPDGRLTPEEIADGYAYLLTRSIVTDQAALQA